MRYAKSAALGKTRCFLLPGPPCPGGPSHAGVWPGGVTPDTGDPGCRWALGCQWGTLGTAWQQAGWAGVPGSQPPTCMTPGCSGGTADPIPRTSRIRSGMFGAAQSAHTRVWCRVGYRFASSCAVLMYTECCLHCHAQPFGHDSGANGQSWLGVLTSRSTKSSLVLPIQKLNLYPLQSFLCILKLFGMHFCFEQQDAAKSYVPSQLTI